MSSSHSHRHGIHSVGNWECWYCIVRRISIDIHFDRPLNSVCLSKCDILQIHTRCLQDNTKKNNQTTGRFINIMAAIGNITINIYNIACICFSAIYSWFLLLLFSFKLLCVISVRARNDFNDNTLFKPAWDFLSIEWKNIFINDINIRFFVSCNQKNIFVTQNKQLSKHSWWWFFMRLLCSSLDSSIVQYLFAQL